MIDRRQTDDRRQMTDGDGVGGVLVGACRKSLLAGSCVGRVWPAFDGGAYSKRVLVVFASVGVGKRAVDKRAVVVCCSRVRREVDTRIHSLQARHCENEDRKGGEPNHSHLAQKQRGVANNQIMVA